MGLRWLYDDSELFLPSAAEHVSVGLPGTQYISQEKKTQQIKNKLS